MVNKEIINIQGKLYQLIRKFPEKTINSIENNNRNIMPKYPFIRSILIKLEECLVLKKKHISKINS